MSHQTGIQVSENLREVFLSASSQDLRLIKVHIQSEELVIDTSLKSNSTWENDFHMLQENLSSEGPCFFLFRKEAENFILFSFVPESSAVRDKMLYAATKASLIKSLGNSYFVDSVHCESPHDLNLDSYKAHQVHQNSDGPLTHHEQISKKVKLQENSHEISVSSKRSHGAGVQFPLSDECARKLQEFTGSSYSYLQFLIKDEVLDVEKYSDVQNLDELSKCLNQFLLDEEPRFVLFKTSIDSLSQTVFLYYCPPSAPVRSKMLYSSSKGSMINVVESHGIVLSKKLELSEKNELTPKFLEESLSDEKPKSEPSKGFIRKGLKAPGGARRLIR